MPYFFFYLGLCLILLHEMDAVKCKEWNIFPLISMLDDYWGYIVFTALHIPLYFYLFWGLFAGSEGINTSLVYGLDIFFIIHFFLHLLFLMHPKNLFKSLFSWSIISGAAIAAMVDLWIHFI